MIVEFSGPIQFHNGKCQLIAEFEHNTEIDFNLTANALLRECRHPVSDCIGIGDQKQIDKFRIW